MAPTEIVKSIATGHVGTLELAHLKTLLRFGHFLSTNVNSSFRNKPDEKECAMLLKRYQERAEMNEADQLAMNLINLTDYVLRLKCLIFKMEFDNRDGIS